MNGLVCNNYYKGLQNFEFWKDELRSSLASDLFNTNTSNVNELIRKIFIFTVNQCKILNPNIQELIESL